MSEPLIRLVAEPELDAAGEATAAAYRDFYPDSPGWRAYVAEIADVRGRAGHTDVLVALVDGEVAGSATLEVDAAIEPGEPAPSPGEVHLRMLGVDPRYRRRGVGEALLRASMEHARRRGSRRMSLHTTPPMHDAQRLYERFGFTRRAAVPAHGLDLIPFDIDLPPPVEEGAST